MPRLFISRLLETFFRRKWLFLLPIVPFVALGVLTVQNAPETWRSTGIILVNRDLVAGTTAQTFGGETPAVYTSRQITTLLGTPNFLGKVTARAAELEPGITSLGLTEDDIRSSLTAAAYGDELVTVSANTENPALSLSLASATITQFPESLKENIRQQSSVVGGGSQTVPGVVGSPEQAALDNITARYRTYDEAKEPVAPEPRRQRDALTLVLFFMLGVIVSAAALVVATLLDHSVRFGEEVENRLHVPVLGAVPNSRAAIKPLVL